jgi:hypothetical protein
MLWCLLLVYCKQVYAAFFDFYLGYHQANSMKQTKLLELIALKWIHIMLVIWYTCMMNLYV